MAKQRKRDAIGNLRELAETVGLTPARRYPDMPVTEFEALHAAVLEKATPEQRLEAGVALQSYRGSGTVSLPPLSANPPLPGAPPLDADSDAVPPVDSAAQESFRVRGTSCLFTWNSKRFSELPREKVWEDFLAFLQALSCVSCWSATMEFSIKSLHDGRVHLHAFCEFVKAVDWTTLDKVKFMGSTPNASPTRARGDNQKQVRDEAHFYCWAWKCGTVEVATSGYVPWKDYIVKGSWIDSLWSAHKLDHTTYLSYAAKVRVGFVNRAKQVEAIRECERAARLRDRRTEVGLLLAPMQQDFKPEILARIAPWQQQYTSIVPRYSFLVLRGASRTGKSSLARSLGGVPFVQTVQSATAPDLRNYEPEVHKYLVFDNVNDMAFVLNYRALFQANNDIHTLGESKTGCYSYDVWIHRVPIVITVDLSANWCPDEPWIRDNCFDVFLTGPSWQEKPRA